MQAETLRNSFSTRKSLHLLTRASMRKLAKMARLQQNLDMSLLNRNTLFDNEDQVFLETRMKLVIIFPQINILSFSLIHQQLPLEELCFHR